MQSIRVISFDLAGTLIHPHPSVGEIYAEVLAEGGISLAPDQLQAAFFAVFGELTRQPRERIDEKAEVDFWREVVTQTVGRVGGEEVPAPLFQKLFATFAEARRWRLAEGAVETLDRLRSAGFRLIAFSNGDARFRMALEELGIADRFEPIFLSSELGFEKPDQRAFDAVRMSIAVEPQAILHMGDSHRADVEGALGAGWRALHFKPGVEPGPDTISSFDEIARRLDSGPIPE